MNFDEAMTKAAQHSIIKLLEKGEWLKLDYNNRLPVPPDMLRTVYASIDMEKVKARCVEAVEQRVADSILTSIATEVATDAKKIMCNTELREEIRSFLRTKMRESVSALS